VELQQQGRHVDTHCPLSCATDEQQLSPGASISNSSASSTKALLGLRSHIIITPRHLNSNVCAGAVLNCRRLFAWKRLWIATMVLNSCYSFYWDVEQDWDMPWLMQYGERLLANQLLVT
jgi:hypothetical protein